METGPSLEQRLLREPLPGAEPPRGRAAFPLLATLLVSLFIAYHLLAVGIHSAPPGGPVPSLQTFFDRHFRTVDYIRAAGIARSWQVFAPDAPRVNAFVRVLVEGTDGEVWDLGHDILGRRQYPYLFYDRIAKINRQMLRRKDYRLTYAGWVCRDWERMHGGEAARAVRLLPVRTRVPPPGRGGYDPRGLDVEEAAPETFPCESTLHGQLPPSLRARYGLPPVAATFRDVPARTWWGRRAPAGVADESGVVTTAPDRSQEPLE